MVVEGRAQGHWGAQVGGCSDGQTKLFFLFFLKYTLHNLTQSRFFTQSCTLKYDKINEQNPLTPLPKTIKKILLICRHTQKIRIL